jgi:hypothetical protein
MSSSYSSCIMRWLGTVIYGILLRAGGSNAQFFKLLRGGKKMSGAWPEEDLVSFINSMDPT